MKPVASVIVPTRARPHYLDVALASILPQARAAGAEVLVVDDGPDAATRAVAARHGARYLAHERSLGPNAARNTGLDHARGELLVYVDDDIEAHPGWLEALLAAHGRAGDEVGVLTGPIRARFEDHPFRGCPREGPPITTQDFGPDDRDDVPHGWGANMAVRRAGLARAGRFDAAVEQYGEEEEWQARLREAGGRIAYVAAAGVDHRRAGDDARLRSLARAAYRRGRPSRRYDVMKGTAPTLARELRVLAGSVLHAVRFACPHGLVMAAHSLGRVRAAIDNAPPPAVPGVDDFLSGRSGTVGGRRGKLRRAADLFADLEAAGRVRALDRAARSRPPRRRVLVTGVQRPGRLMGAARAELERSRHEVALRVVALGEGGKFAHLNRTLAEHDPAGSDWLLVLDDDVVLPRGFLDRFLLCAERAGLRIAQPAHRVHSHAGWPVTRRRPGGAVRLTRFVEIGPVTAFHRDVFAALLPFPDLQMGWGLDAHWGAVAREQGWRCGVVDATPVLHTVPVASDYDRTPAVEEARAFLRDRPYVTRDEATWSRRVRLSGA
ncbi:MAG: glycosyltransferase family 2 protein [Solirubrobacteraceae bacterium]